MCGKHDLDEIMKKVLRFSESKFGDKLNAVILYGSYARGDFDNESDIDVMVLVNMNRESLKAYREVFARFSTLLDLEYETLVSIFLNDAEFFNKWREDMPFYRNVWNEGIRISA